MVTVAATCVALLALADCARSIVRALVPAGTSALLTALALVVGASLLCAGYGLLGQLSTRSPAEIELVFHGDAVAAPRSSTTQGAGELRVIEDRVTNARATPRNLAIFAIACAVIARLVTRGARVRARSPRLTVTAIWLLPIALSGIAAVRSVARGYDALWYHLPLAAAFQHSGHLEPPGRDLVFYFPGNVELLCRALGDLLGTHGPPLVQLPFALALGALTAGLARRLGAGRAASYAGAIAIACPMVIFQAGLAYTDIVAAAALVAGAVLFLDALGAQGARALGLALVSGLCLGLLLGSKYAALPLLATGLPVFFVAALRGPGEVQLRRTHLPRAVALLAFVAAGVVLPAWFWYARNARLTGNPIFPIAVPGLGLRGLFLSDAFNRGKELELVGSHREWLAYPWLESLSHESGFGAAFAALVPVSLGPLAVGLFSSLRRGRWPRYALPFVWALVYLASWWVATPHEVRHLLPLVPLLGAPAALLLRGSSPRARGLRQVAVAALAVSCLVVVRIQLYSDTPELSARATSYAALYGLPARVLDDLPVSARVANLAGRPYNLAVRGPHDTLEIVDYAPDLPSAATLDDRGARYVFIRGSEAAIDAARRAGEDTAAPWIERYRGPAREDQDETRPGPDGGNRTRAWIFWGATRTDTLALFERPTKRVGDAPAAK